MTQKKTQRGSLLSSIVMVMLATVATAMLAFIGFQALPDSVIPATFGGDDRTSRHVNVSEAPKPEAPKPTADPRPTSVPSTNPPFPSATANPRATDRPTHEPKPTRAGSTTVRETTAPKPVTTTTAPKPKPTTTTTAPKPSPSASQSTQTASPAPTCGTGRKPRCPRGSADPAPAASPTRQASYGDSSYSGSSYSGSTTTATKKSTKKSTKKQATKKSAPKARKGY